MIAPTVLKQIQNMGGELWVDGDQLGFRIPEKVITFEMMEALKKCKLEIMLGCDPCHIFQVVNASLEDFRYSPSVAEIYANILCIECARYPDNISDLIFADTADFEIDAQFQLFCMSSDLAEFGHRLSSQAPCLSGIDMC